jgi:hypothetical protein
MKYKVSSVGSWVLTIVLGVVIAGGVVIATVHHKVVTPVAIGTVPHSSPSTTTASSGSSTPGTSPGAIVAPVTVTQHSTGEPGDNQGETTSSTTTPSTTTSTTIVIIHNGGGGDDGGDNGGGFTTTTVAGSGSGATTTTIDD